MGLINSILTWVFKQRMDQVHDFMKNPVKTQHQVFQELISSAADTVWGKKFGYRNIKTQEQFSERVPVQDYDSIKPYIERLMKGEQNILWPTEIKWFAKSSGTTSDKSKFIPVSREALDECHFKAGKDTMAIYCYNNPKTNVFSGKGLIMGGSTQVNKMSEDSFYGDVSAVMMKNMPLLAHIIKTPDLSVALMEDWEKKITKIAEETIEKNVTHMAGVPTWTVVLIHKIFEMTGKNNLRDVWPNLELYIHGGVAFTPYREQFRNLIRGGGMHYLETYNASEGFFGIQYDLSKPDLLLMLDYGIYFEFIPAEKAESENPQAIPLEGVETGKNYAMVISTNAGLWRYKIGDTVEFTSINPYKIRISGRTKFYINAFGEEVIVDNADKAIAKACEQTGAIVNDYTAAPIYFSEGEKGAHEWIIEFEKAPQDFDHFVKVLDQTLQQVNSDYEAKRQNNMALRLPTVHPAAPQTFYNWMKSRGKLGGQNKVPRLSNNRNYVEDILKFMGE